MTIPWQVIDEWAASGDQDSNLHTPITVMHLHDLFPDADGIPFDVDTWRPLVRANHANQHALLWLARHHLPISAMRTIVQRLAIDPRLFTPPRWQSDAGPGRTSHGVLAVFGGRMLERVADILSADQVTADGLRFLDDLATASIDQPRDQDLRSGLLHVEGLYRALVGLSTPVPTEPCYCATCGHEHPQSPTRSLTMWEQAARYHFEGVLRHETARSAEAIDLVVDLVFAEPSGD